MIIVDLTFWLGKGARERKSPEVLNVRHVKRLYVQTGPKILSSRTVEEEVSYVFRGPRKVTAARVISLTGEQPIISVNLMVMSLPKEGSAARWCMIFPDVIGKKVSREMIESKGVASSRRERRACRSTEVTVVLIRRGKMG